MPEEDVQSLHIAIAEMRGQMDGVAQTIERLDTRTSDLTTAIMTKTSTILVMLISVISVVSLAAGGFYMLAIRPVQDNVIDLQRTVGAQQFQISQLDKAGAALRQQNEVLQTELRSEMMVNLSKERQATAQAIEDVRIAMQRYFDDHSLKAETLIPPDVSVRRRRR